MAVCSCMTDMGIKWFNKVNIEKNKTCLLLNKPKEHFNQYLSSTLSRK